MKTLNTQRIIGAFTAVILGGTMLGAGLSTAQNVDASNGEVLTRGPVHEAFAATVSYDPEPGILVDVQPPAAIEEIPPDQRLEGENVTWIPGYWAWDEDSNDFLWISGIWRNLPPGRQWVPGYWAQADGRYQWTSGYWEDAEVAEVAYLPKPPRSVETGPNIEAPSRDVSWLPGSWAWQDDRYAWRAGYWAPVRENWIWVPSYYRWTPRGYVCVDGYWDYAIARRGVVFAPVRFGRNVYSRPGFYYSPTTVISLTVFVNHLFLRPSYGHYYFGDYYGSSYHNHGYYASYSYGSGRRGCDPIYNHYRWENRNDRNWDRQRREYYEHRRDHENARPPRTWAALNSIPEAERRAENFGVAQPLDRLASSGNGGRQRFQAVDKKDRERFVSQRQEIGKFTRERQQLETREAKVAAEGSTAPATRVKVNRSPVVASQLDRPGKGETPPERLAPSASEQARQKGKHREKAEPVKRPAGETPIEPAHEKDRTTHRKGDESSKSKEEDPASKRKEEPRPEPQADPEPSTKMTPEPAREVTPEPSRKTDSGTGSKEESRPEPRSEPDPSPKMKPEPTREVTPEPSRTTDSGRDSKKESRPEPRSEPDPSPKMKPEPTREVNPEPSRKTDSGKGSKEESRPTEVREPKSKPAPREMEPVPARKAEPTAPKSVEQPRPAPEPRERTEKKQTPQVQQPSRRVEPAPVERQQIQRPQQPSRRVEPAPVERQQIQRPQQPSRRVEPAPVERQQIQRPQQPSRRVEPAPVERQQIQRPQREPQPTRPERVAPKQPQVERAPRPSTSKEKEAERGQ